MTSISSPSYRFSKLTKKCGFCPSSRGQHPVRLEFLLSLGNQISATLPLSQLIYVFFLLHRLPSYKNQHFLCKMIMHFRPIDNPNLRSFEKNALLCVSFFFSNSFSLRNQHDMFFCTKCSIWHGKALHFYFDVLWRKSTWLCTVLLLFTLCWPMKYRCYLGWCMRKGDEIICMYFWVVCSHCGFCVRILTRCNVT